MTGFQAKADEHYIEGIDLGAIPGLPGRDAFRVEATEPSAIPILVAAPHAGRAYSPQLLDSMRNPGLTCHRLEDRLVDVVATRLARQTGAALIVADAPRALIDLNRDCNDIDWSMIAGGRGDSQAPDTPEGGRAIGGLGLVPRRLGGVGEIWKARLNRSELLARIDRVHRPYHRALGQVLQRMKRRWGQALLLDIHSMPPLPGTRNGRGADIVLGDRFGASCSGALVASAFDYFSQVGLRATYNRPYAGGFVLNQHGNPTGNIHALQIEICRSLYLDSHLVDLTGQADCLVSQLSGLVDLLSHSLAGLNSSKTECQSEWQQAAE
ncbi:MAG: N-formylglutamate amidohydrolase [Caenibius sp.]